MTASQMQKKWFSVIVVVVASFLVVPIPSSADFNADFNNDGHVDADDYTIWENNFGRTDATHSTGDANADGVVDAADYTIWVNSFGQSVNGGSGAVEEQDPPPTIEPQYDADFNNDDQVDAADYIIWANNFGRTDATHSTGDANGDGLVNAADFTIWADTFGTASAEPDPVEFDADFNNDDQVDAADYIIWTNNFGRTDATHAMGDANGDGVVDAADYTVWADEFGSGGPSDPPPANEAPTLNAMTGVVAYMGEELTRQFTASDPEDDPLEFSSNDLPSGATLTTDGLLTWTPAMHGKTMITIAVSDGDLGDSGSIIIYVVPRASGGEYPRFFVEHHGGPHGDWLPDVAYSPTKVAIASGNWSDSSIWIGTTYNNIPGLNDVVLIPRHITVNYNIESDVRIDAIGIKGTLEFDSTVPTKLKVGTILVYGTTDSMDAGGEPAYQGGAFSIHTEDPEMTTEIIFSGEVDTFVDPGQFMLGLISAGGTVAIDGAHVATPYSKVESASLNSDVVTVVGTADWNVGDELYFADSQAAVNPNDRAYAYQGERAFITSIENQNSMGTTVTLDRDLQYEHTDGYVANLTRNVVFRSEDPSVVTRRGHILLAGPTDHMVCNARLIDLGRTTTDVVDESLFDNRGDVLPAICDVNGKTLSGAEPVPHIGLNQRARHSLNAHHSDKEFLWDGNVIDGYLKWGIVNRDSFGSITGNVVVAKPEDLTGGGAGIAGADGSEVGDIGGNLVIGVGTGVGVLHKRLPFKDHQCNFLNSVGHEGYGYWFYGPLLKISNNVAVGYFRNSGFNYDIPISGSPVQIQIIPDIPGMRDDPYYAEILERQTANMNHPDPKKQIDGINIQKEANALFDGNIADGYTKIGSLVEFWYSNATYSITNMTVNHRNKGYHYPAVSNIAMFFAYTQGNLDGLQVTGTRGLFPPSEDLSLNEQLKTIGIKTNSRQEQVINVENSNISGFYHGIFVAGSGGLMKNNVLKNHKNITFGVHPGRHSYMKYTREARIEGNLFQDLFPGSPHQHNISMEMGANKSFYTGSSAKTRGFNSITTTYHLSRLFAKDRIHVIDYQWEGDGLASGQGPDFFVFHSGQEAEPVLIHSSINPVESRRSDRNFVPLCKDKGDWGAGTACALEIPEFFFANTTVKFQRQMSTIWDKSNDELWNEHGWASWPEWKTKKSGPCPLARPSPSH